MEPRFGLHVCKDMYAHGCMGGFDFDCSARVVVVRLRRIWRAKFGHGGGGAERCQSGERGGMWGRREGEQPVSVGPTRGLSRATERLDDSADGEGLATHPFRLRARAGTRRMQGQGQCPQCTP